MRLAYVHGYDGVTAALLLGACLDAGASLQAVQAGWGQLGLPSVAIASQPCAYVSGVATTVQWPPLPALDELFPSYEQLMSTIAQRAVPALVRQRLQCLLERFGQAVSRVQGGTPAAQAVMLSPLLPELLYLGSAIAYALEELVVQQVMAAPIPLYTGAEVRAAGRRPQLQPLTAALSRGVPVYGPGVPSEGELSTVSGVAILTAYAERFGPLPDMTLVETGYGVVTDADGTVRSLQVCVGVQAGPVAAERIAVIEANIDDMNPEFYESVAEHLFAQGALDVTLTPLFMKKNRPATTLTVLAPVSAVAALSALMLQETSTFGVRVHEVWRHKLDRFHRQVETRYGTIPVKCGVFNGRIVQAAPEYEACKQAARACALPVRLVYAEAASLAAAWLHTVVAPSTPE
ncbi:MAG: LarC family nickel insertion protein [Candidatus Tectimicrobiota bacterium]